MRTEFSSSLYFERRLSLLLLVSLLLHLLLLAWLYGPQVKVQVQAKALPLLMATLRLPAAASESLPSALRESVTPAPAALQKTRQTPPRRERLPVAVAERGAGSPIAPTAAKPEAELPAPMALAAPEAAATKAAPRTEPRESETELLAAYRRRLGEILARQQVYPRIAAQRGWEGEVRLRLSVAHQGQLLAVKLERSSGYEVLDQHALAMLAALASLPPLPDALESREVQVVVPVHYKLKKTT